MSGPAVFDKTRLYLIGHSAGAHILTSLFLDAALPRLAPRATLLQAVQGILLASGIYDLDALLATFPSYDGFIARAFTPPYARWNTLGYPLHSMSTAIRWRIVHSYGDTLVPVDQSDRMCDHLKAVYAARNWDEGFITQDYGTVTTDHDYVRGPIFAKLVSDWVSNKVI